MSSVCTHTAVQDAFDKPIEVVDPRRPSVSGCVSRNTHQHTSKQGCGEKIPESVQRTRALRDTTDANSSCARMCRIGRAIRTDPSHIQTTHPANPKKVDATVARHVPITCDLHIAVRHPAALTLLVDVAIGAVDASRSERYVVPDSDTSLPE